MLLTRQTIPCIRRQGSSARPAALVPRGRSVRLACSAKWAPPQGAVAAGKVAAVALFAGAALTLLDTGAAHANRELVGEFTASGFLFKDQIDVTAVEDPEISGVVLYFSDFKRNIVDKLSKDFFTEPSQASLTCVVNGPVTIRDEKRISSFEGNEVFSEQKGLNLFKNKTLRVRRIYDAERRTVVYVAYSTRLSTASDEGGVSAGRYRTSMCAVGLPAPVLAPALTIAAPELASVGR